MSKISSTIAAMALAGTALTAPMKAHAFITPVPPPVYPVTHHHERTQTGTYDTERNPQHYSEMQKQAATTFEELLLGVVGAFSLAASGSKILVDRNYGEKTSKGMYAAAAASALTIVSSAGSFAWETHRVNQSTAVYSTAQNGITFTNMKGGQDKVVISPDAKTGCATKAAYTMNMKTNVSDRDPDPDYPVARVNCTWGRPSTPTSTLSQ